MFCKLITILFIFFIQVLSKDEKLDVESGLQSGNCKIILEKSIVACKSLNDSNSTKIKGNFTDDYGIKYSISDSLWFQHPNAKYHIIKCDTTNQYLLVRNDANNPSEAGLFSRIDYMKFTNMEPFLWGFCLTVYDAKTVEEAETKAKADRSNPRKGCGGFPFSRMKRVE